MNLKFVYIFIKVYGWYQIKRQLSFTLSYMILPLSLLFIFSIIANGVLIKFAIVGGLVSIVASVSLYSLFDAAYLRIQLKIHDLLVATRITPIDYMLGITLSEFAYSIPGVLLYLLIGLVYHLFTLSSLPYMFVILFLLYVSIASLGFAISFIPSHMRNVWGYSGLISMAFTFIPPIFYSYQLLPNYLLYLFMLSPSTPAAMLMQGLYGLAPFSSLAVYVLVIETVLFLIAAGFLTRWRSI